MLDTRINALKGQVVRFSALVENMQAKAVAGLVNSDQDLLHAVVDVDEPQANRTELEVEEGCIHLIAQFQPMARDLRTLLVIHNMSNDLERMADHAVNIAVSAREILRNPPIKRYLDIPRMSVVAGEMLAGAISAFMDEDASRARKVLEQDAELDHLRDQILREMITFMTENPRIIGTSIHVLRIAENLERIGDLATNICEDVIFMSQGTVIKHLKDCL